MRSDRLVIRARKQDPTPKEPMEQLSFKAPVRHKGELLKKSEESGYPVPDLLRLALSHFLNTVEITKEDAEDA